MTWEIFYLICFGVGLALTVLSLAGGFHHHVHFGLHRAAHISHVHGTGGRAGQRAGEWEEAEETLAVPILRRVFARDRRWGRGGGLVCDAAPV